MKSEDYIVMLKAISDKTRLETIELLAQDNELCACKILEKFAITQPTLSHHMKILEKSGLVTTKKVGKWIHYILNKKSFKELEKLFKKLSSDNVDLLKKEECKCK